MNFLTATLAAYSHLRDQEVTDRLGLDLTIASRLGFALVADADLAPQLAADLLAKHAQAIKELERQERYATAEPGYDDGEPVLFYELTSGMRRCVELLEALRVIAETGPATLHAA